jgi:hypothetical protein
MRWFNWIKPGNCEIPGCTQTVVRNVYIMGATRAWLCEEHAAQLERPAPVRIRSARP